MVTSTNVWLRPELDWVWLHRVRTGRPVRADDIPDDQLPALLHALITEHGWNENQIVTTLHIGVRRVRNLLNTTNQGAP